MSFTDDGVGISECVKAEPIGFWALVEYTDSEGSWRVAVPMPESELTTESDGFTDFWLDAGRRANGMMCHYEVRHGEQPPSATLRSFLGVWRSLGCKCAVESFDPEPEHRIDHSDECVARRRDSTREDGERIKLSEG